MNERESPLLPLFLLLFTLQHLEKPEILDYGNVPLGKAFYHKVFIIVLYFLRISLLFSLYFMKNMQCHFFCFLQTFEKNISAKDKYVFWSLDSYEFDLHSNALKKYVISWKKFPYENFLSESLKVTLTQIFKNVIC